MKKIKYVLLVFGVMLLLLGIGIVWSIATLSEASRSDYLFCRQMSEYTAAFDALNQAVYEQFPAYPDAQLITITIAGGDQYFWTPSSRHLHAHYISDAPYLQIQEFFEQEMQVQNWQLMNKEVFQRGDSHLYYQKCFTCVTLYIETWDENKASFISHISSTSEVPISTKSTYEVRIVHAQEAVPGAPTPHPEGSSLIECFVDEP
jgi:hypothetical protein